MLDSQERISLKNLTHNQL